MARKQGVKARRERTAAAAATATWRGWSVEDVYRDLTSNWAEPMYGVVVLGSRLALPAWADDSWITARSADELKATITDLRVI